MHVSIVRWRKEKREGEMESVNFHARNVGRETQPQQVEFGGFSIVIAILRSKEDPFSSGRTAFPILAGPNYSRRMVVTSVTGVVKSALLQAVTRDLCCQSERATMVVFSARPN